MKTVKLTKKAQNIINQIMSADAVVIEYGPHIHRAYAEDILLSNKGIQFSVENDKNDRFIEISNADLNKAKISPDDAIVINASDFEKRDMTITLYQLGRINAV